MDNLWLGVYRIPDDSSVGKSTLYSMWGIYTGKGKPLKYKCTNLACQVVLEANFPRYDRILNKTYGNKQPGWRCPCCAIKIED